MGTYCALIVADLFLFCYDRDFMLSLSDKNQANVIEVFNSTSIYLDDLLNIDKKKCLWSRHCRPTHGTVRKSYIIFTVTRHPNDNKTK